MNVMRVRKSNALMGAGVIFGFMFMLYLVIDTLNVPFEEQEMNKIEIGSLESKLKSLESDLVMNQETIKKIKETVQELRHEQASIRQESKAVRSRGKGSVNKTFASISKADFTFARTAPNECDIRMSDIYDEIPFDNPDGGVWKQGWPINLNEKEVVDPKNKLKVFIMPHSHNDPGWIKTFEKYYQDQTKHILDNMVVKLAENPKRKFIWAEISFFAMWWVEQKMETRTKVLKLLNSGQLEIVTGGWVMADEANGHYSAMLEELITGHEWCNLNLNGYKPNNGWAIDPFGMTPTMAYLLKRVGFDAMLIQRTHYSVKKRLAKTKDLEFNWRQHWDHEDSTDMMTHMMPFYSYDVPHTCGPEPKVCCQFDFDRLPGGIAGCPWRVAPKPITDSNVAERSALILDQWRKKGQLYKTNVVLIPLGDDFRYDTAREWDRQFMNYEKIIDHINADGSLNAEVQFGTLEDYFSAVRDQSKVESGTETGMFKSLSGDFFTYADRDDHYWSGYYTSRPFYKNMDRVLEGHLRAAEILFSMMWAEMEYVGSDITELSNPLMESLILSRQALSLFQHHDGVTGTAKDHVMKDYGEKMLDAITRLQKVQSQAAHYLLTPSKAFYKSENAKTVFYDLDENRDNHNSLPKQMTIQVERPEDVAKVVVFNSHARRRGELVTVKISRPDVKVYRINNVDGDDDEEILASQISPVFDDEQGQILNNEFKLSFLAQAKGLALQTFYIRQLRAEDGSNQEMSVGNVKIYNSGKTPFQVPPFDNVDVFASGEEFTLSNGYVQADFGEDGLLKAMTTTDDKVKTEVKLEFVRYGTRARGDKSGAYLFLPDGPAKPMPLERPIVRVVEGKLLSTVEVFAPFVKHTIMLKSTPDIDGTGLHIENDVDIRQLNNVELAMRFSSSLASGQTFFTDLNGFQMMKRKRMTKIPLQANYFPVPTLIYAEDEKSRLSLFTRQPLGGSSLAPGQVELMMDRRLMQDDNRGLFQGVTDNHITPHSFYLLLERKTKNCQDEADDPMASYPSLLAVNVRHHLLNPFHRMIWTQSSTSGDMLSKSYEPLDKDLSCDVHVVNLRTMQGNAFKPDPSNEAALILHRRGFNGCYKPVGMTCSTNGGKISLEELFPELYGSSVKQMSLSLLYEGLKVEKGFTVSIKPMEMYSFLLRR